jgi:hypothetical protein
MRDLKARIIAEYEREPRSGHLVARDLGADRDYTEAVLRTHRGSEDGRADLTLAEAHRSHVRDCLLAGGFKWLVRA